MISLKGVVGNEIKMACSGLSLSSVTSEKRSQNPSEILLRRNVFFHFVNLPCLNFYELFHQTHYRASVSDVQLLLVIS